MASLEEGLSRLAVTTDETKSEEEVELVPCSFQFHSFTASLNDSPYNFETILMSGSLFIWIGNSKQMNNLAMAMTCMDKRSPTATVLMGDPTDNVSYGIAKRLSKRLKKQVFVSYNAESDKMLISGIEKRILEEITARPNKF